MKSSDWEGAYPSASPTFERAIRSALEKTKAQPDRPASFRFSRRRAALIVALALLLAGGVTAAGLMDRGYNLMQQEVYDTDKSMVVIGDTLYVTDGFKLLSYAPGAGESVTLIEQVIRHDSYQAPEQKNLRKSPYYIDLLLNIDGSLCGMNAKSGLVFDIAWENGQGVYHNRKKMQLQYNMCRGDHEDSPRSMAAPVVQGGVLYFVQWDPYAGSSDMRVAAYDLKTGQGGLKKVKNVQLLAPYQDGLLLALTRDEDGKTALQIYDPAADTLKAALDLSKMENTVQLTGLEYSREKDCAWLFDAGSGVVYQMPGLENPEKAALVSNVSFSHCAFGRSSALVEDTFYCAQDRKGLYVRNLEAGYQAPLAIRLEESESAAGLAEEALRAASEKTGLESACYPVSRNDSPTLQELLVTRDDQYDLYVFSTRMQDLPGLMAKGYAPLAPDLPALSQLHQAVYPFIRTAVSKSGRMAAVPLNLSVTTHYADRAVLSRLGLSSAPATIEELAALISAWAAGAYPGAETNDLPLETDDYRTALVRLALTLYERQCAARGEMLSLQDASLLRVLSSLEQMDWDQIDEAFACIEDEENYVPPNALLSLDAPFMPSPWGDAFPVAFSLDGHSNATACELTVAIVNPFGKRQAEAWEWLNGYVSSLPPVTRVLLCPDENQPVENPAFASMTAELSNLIAEYEAKKNDDAVFQYQKELAETERYYRFLFPADSIAQYRQMMEHAFLPGPDTLSGKAEGSLQALLSRYLDGEISLAQFAQEGNARLSLMQRE